MIIRPNPVIANYDVLFFGKKRFSSLAKAKKIKFRPKGVPDAPWQEIDVTKFRKKLDKQNLLFRHLEDDRRQRDIASKKKIKAEEKAERQRVKALHRAKDVQAKSEIKFRLVKTKENIVRSKEGKDVRYKSYVFELKTLLKFVSGTKPPNSIQIEQFLLAVGEQFKKVFKQHKRTSYFLRITHRYRALKDKDNKKKTFDGYALPRYKYDSTRDIDAAIRVLMESYLPSFEKYLKFATQNTSFDFLGFVLEVTLPNIR